MARTLTVCGYGRRKREIVRRYTISQPASARETQANNGIQMFDIEGVGRKGEADWLVYEGSGKSGPTNKSRVHQPGDRGKPAGQGRGCGKGEIYRAWVAGNEMIRAGEPTQTAPRLADQARHIIDRHRASESTQTALRPADQARHITNRHRRGDRESQQKHRS